MLPSICIYSFITFLIVKVMSFNIASSSTVIPSTDLLTVKEVKELNTPKKLSDFLKGRLSGIDDQINTLKAQRINGEVFLELTQEDLKGVGILLGPAKKILKLINKIKEEQPSATGKRSFSELDEPHNNQNLKRNKISLDSLLELRQHISVDKSPIVFIPFIPRPNIQKQICDEIYISTLLVYGSNRHQDYRGIVISGDSGVGKTRIGFEIENFIVNDERIQTRMDSLKITFKHIFIRMNEIINLLGKEQENFPGTNKYPRFPEDFYKAREVLIMLIAIYFFAGVWTLTSIKSCKELIPKIMNYKEIINLIRKEMKLDQDALLVLILQIDEFQTSTYWTVTLLRVISTIVDTNKTLIVSVCTGTAPSQISDLSSNRSSIVSVSQYKTTNINLSPMSFSESEKIFHQLL